MPHASKPRSTTAAASRDHYAAVTAQVIAALEAGTPPWRRPWDQGKAAGPAMPQNATTGVRYRGINCVVLGLSPLAFTSGDPRWATYKQAAERGWQVRRGEHGTTAYFFKRLELRDGDAGPGEDATRRIPMLRAFTLFHVSQMEGVPPFVPPSLEEAPWREPEAAAIIARQSRAVIRVGGDRAFYSPLTDHVQMPPAFAFRSPAAFASVLQHELAHWTGSKERLDRDLSGRFGSHEYAREELRAELAQVFVCAELGIADCEFTNGAAYIAEWLKRLRDDKKEVFRAAAEAQRIADYLLAFHPAYRDRRRDDSAGGTEADPHTPAESIPVAREAA